MAYIVKYGSDVLHDPLIHDELRAVYDARISMRAKSYSEFEFTIPPNHPLSGRIKLHDMERPVSVTFDGELVFKGVVTSKSVNIHKEMTVRCASELVFLSWIVTRFKPTGAGTASDFASLLGIYNSYANIRSRTAQEDPYDFAFFVDPQSKADQVGYEDGGSKHVSAETTSPQSVLSIIEDEFLTPYDAYLRLRYGSDGRRYIGIFPIAPDGNTQEIRFGDNLTEFEYEESDEGMFNAVYATGKSKGSMDADATSVRLTLQSPASPGDAYITVSAGTDWDIHSDGIVIYEVGDNSTRHVGSMVVINQDEAGVPAGEARTLRLLPGTPEALPTSAKITYLGLSPYMYDGNLTLKDYPIIEADYRTDQDLAYNIENAYAYGFMCDAITDNTIEDAQTLYQSAKARIAQGMQPTRNVSINAIDMALYKTGHKHLLAGQRVRFVSEPHGIDDLMQVTECELDMDDPGNTRYTLGTVGASMTGALGKEREGVRNVRDNFMSELNNRISAEEVWS